MRPVSTFYDIQLSNSRGSIIFLLTGTYKPVEKELYSISTLSSYLPPIITQQTAPGIKSITGKIFLRILNSQTAYAIIPSLTVD